MAGAFQDSKTAYEDRIAERDKLTINPAERAKEIWIHVQLMKPRPTLWDLVCFSIETLGVACSEYPILLAGVKTLTRLIYGVHYNTSEPFPSAFTRAESKPNS